jgi:transposase
MGQLHTEEFKREAVRLAKTSGLTRKQVAADLGIGLSTLGKWISADRPEAPADLPPVDLLKEVEQLRRENRILKEERDILKKATAFFASQK